MLQCQNTWIEQGLPWSKLDNGESAIQGADRVKDSIAPRIAA
jgi:hypothetical protein